MPKIKITENQLKLIINYINENNVIKDVLREDYFNNKQSINEGWKEVILGTAMLLGLNLSGQNKILAQDSLKNPKIMAQIKSTLESDKIDDLATSLEDAGLKNALDKIETNAKTIEAKFNKIAQDDGLNYKLVIKTVESEKELSDKLRQGYAIKNIDTKNNNVKQNETKIVEVIDTLDIKFGSDNFFVTAGFELNPNAVDTINGTINDIKNQGGTIIDVNIESSTDTEPIKMGNEKLSELRSNSIKDVLLKDGIDASHITINPLFNQGPNLYSTTMSKDQRINARKETSKYRYVKLTITAVFKNTITENPVAPQVVETRRFEVVKLIEKTGKSNKIGTKANFHKKHKGCKIFDFLKGGKDKHVANCPVF